MHRGRHLVGPGMVAQRGIKAALLVSTILLALVGTVVAEERDPRLKDPTIDFNTVDLSTLPPLQFTFVPEWRKLEGFRRFLQLMGKAESFIGEGYEDFCTGFWKDFRSGQNIDVVIPVMRTNFSSDMEKSPLKQACKNLDLEFPQGIPRNTDRIEGNKARYGFKIYDVSRNGRKQYLYEYGIMSHSMDGSRPLPWPETPGELDKRLSKINDGFVARESNYVWYPNEGCGATPANSGGTPFVIDTGYSNTTVTADAVLIKRSGAFYVLSVSEQHDNGEIGLSEIDDNQLRVRPKCFFYGVVNLH